MNLFNRTTPRLRDASEFQDIKGWINSKPLTLKDLHGKIVFLDFWTFGCINCINTRPYFRKMYNRFKNDERFVMIGIHSPEFDFERDQENVKNAVEKYGLQYPIALDSDNTTWKLYGNHYWPRQAMIDVSGRIRYEHIGEGSYEEMERRVSDLLAETVVGD
jgi:thiol-disulfide isomerase/thioredoxin